MPRSKHVFWCLLLTLAAAASPISSLASTKFDPGLAPFPIELNGVKVSGKITFQPILPGEVLQIKVPSHKAGSFLISQNDRSLSMSESGYTWVAPDKPGYYPLKIIRRDDNEKILLQVLVMQPASKVANGKLNGYNIGQYPSPLKGLQSYKAPKGFIELTPELEHLAISPHFTLGQFACKQSGGYPKYLVLRPKLLEKLEFLLKEVNQQGIRTDSFVVMSGYRTPFYNRVIKNVSNSRHIFGGAADIYIDVNPADGVMDDLNRDGKVNEKDAAFLYRIADKLALDIGRKDLFGGVGNYSATAAHGPFIHVDVRGTPARWGL